MSVCVCVGGGGVIACIRDRNINFYYESVQMLMSAYVSVTLLQQGLTKHELLKLTGLTKRNPYEEQPQPVLSHLNFFVGAKEC